MTRTSFHWIRVFVWTAVLAFAAFTLATVIPFHSDMNATGDWIAEHQPLWSAAVADDPELSQVIFSIDYRNTRGVLVVSPVLSPENEGVLSRFLEENPPPIPAKRSIRNP